jgi:predicted CXXCH cytochrome family protein
MKPITLLIALVVAVSLRLPGLAQTLPKAIEPPSVISTHIAPVNGGGYAGVDRCRNCHKAEVIQYEKTRHSDLKPARTDSVIGCEMCHGPGKAHSDAAQAAQGDDAKTAAASKLIFSFNGNPKRNSAVCIQCHATSKEQSGYSHSTHANHGVACQDCHATHLVAAAENPNRLAQSYAQAQFFTVPKLPEERRWLNTSLLKKAQPDLCYSCHANIQAMFALPTHHRVPEGAMKCTDCHSPHGTSNRATLRKSGWETCVGCHVEKRGPFVFEHSAVKVEGCLPCHNPHGSVNRMLLTRREERFTCLQCHVNPFAVNVPHSRLSFQTRGDCSRCHAAIHGSNFDPAFLH